MPVPHSIARVLVLFAVAEAETQAMRVDVNEVVGVARAAQFHRHTVLVRPEITHIGVEGGAFRQGESLANAEVEAAVSIRAVISGILAVQAIVTLGAACACGGDRDIAEVQCYSTPRPWICRL